jgi:hypothetical protein
MVTVTVSVGICDGSNSSSSSKTRYVRSPTTRSPLGSPSCTTISPVPTTGVERDADHSGSGRAQPAYPHHLLRVRARQPDTGHAEVSVDRPVTGPERNPESLTPDPDRPQRHVRRRADPTGTPLASRAGTSAPAPRRTTRRVGQPIRTVVHQHDCSPRGRAGGAVPRQLPVHRLLQAKLVLRELVDPHQQRHHQPRSVRPRPPGPGCRRPSHTLRRNTSTLRSSAPVASASSAVVPNTQECRSARTTCACGQFVAGGASDHDRDGPLTTDGYRLGVAAPLGGPFLIA